MPVELDHLFILTDVQAPLADRLVARGFAEGLSRNHPGQGTANRCFFFHNIMLELLWVHTPAEAQSKPIQPTHLWERWRDRAQGACPFGICLRSTAPDDTLPFTYWDYRPPYLPATAHIAIGTNSHILTEPLIFHISFGQRPDTFPPERVQPLTHPAGIQEITRLAVTSPHSAAPSPELSALLNRGLLTLSAGDAYLMELGCDREQQGQPLDFRPELPLLIRY